MMLEAWNGTTTIGFARGHSLGKHVWLNSLITNNTGGSITLNMYVSKLGGSGFIRVCPKNLTLAVGESFENNNIGLAASQQFKLEVSGSVDYYIVLHEDYSQ